MVDSITVYGPLTIGTTEDTVGVYTVLSSQEAIKYPIEVTFRARMYE